MEIFSDGGARGNPGKAACAFIVKDGSNTIHKGSKYLGVATNNVAEYEGVILALEWLIKNQNGKGDVSFLVDSELIAKQINGLYKIKDINLKKLNDRVKNLLKDISVTVNFKHIPRSMNKSADLLVNKTLDEI
jgi:ribonuclease HI